MAIISVYFPNGLLQDTGDGVSSIGPDGLLQGEQSASAPVGPPGSDTAGSRLLYGATVVPNGGQATLTLFDNATAASGTVLLKIKTSSNKTVRFNRVVRAKNGIFADFSGPAGSAHIVYIANRSQDLAS